MAESVAGSMRGKLAMLGYLMGQGRALRRVARQVGASLVHAHWWFPAGLAAPRPFMVTMHGSDVRLAAQKTWAHPLFRGVLRRAKAVTTVSRFLADRAKAIAPFAQPIVAPMPVKTAVFLPAAGVRTTDDILFVGRLNEQKGLHVLLDALAAIRRPVRLQVVGEGPNEAALRRRAATLGVADRITWHGLLNREALLALYQRAAAVAIPSRDEGLGLVAVEAQLCETPVVAFDSGGLPDVIVHGETGLLTPPGDANAMAAALDRVLADSQLARTLGASGRRAALAAFSPDAVAARYAELYRRAVGHAAA